MSLAIENRNSQVKAYIEEHFALEPKKVESSRLSSKEAKIPNIFIPKLVGKILHTFVSLHKPKRILEIGTLAGYSTLWLAEALPMGGAITTIEREEEHIELAQRHFKEAGCSDQIAILHGDALEVLNQLIAEKVEPFDLIFLDADKQNYSTYLEPILSLSRPGTLILSDNLIPKRGAIGDPDSNHEEGGGIYQYNSLIANHPRLDSHLFPTVVGEKGRIDALGVSIVKE